MSPSSEGNVLNVGIVGSGGIARQHAIGWTAYPDKARIAAFADIAIDRAKTMSDTHTDGVANAYASLDEMLADESINVIDICLPHHLHTDAVIAAAKAGRAVLCEKPLCTNLADARKIKQALDESGVIFMSAHNQLFQPSLLEARRLISSGTIGTPYFFRSIETFQARSFNPHSNEMAEVGAGQKGWRGDLAQSGGGELLDTGYHSTYRLLSLANNDRPVEVTGFLSRFLIGHLPTEDTGQVMVRFESGSMGEILTSWALDVVGGVQFEASGEHGALAGSPTDLRHQIYRWPAPAQREFTEISSFTAEIGHFIDVVTSGADNPANIDIATRVLQLIKGAYLSAKLGQTVTLPENPTDDPVAGAQGTTTPFSVEVPDAVLS
jgi:predicted dehydrogenase